MPILCQVLAHRAYLLAYSPGRHEELKAVACDFCESRAGQHVDKFHFGT